jgi:hypothetical protein
VVGWLHRHDRGDRLLHGGGCALLLAPGYGFLNDHESAHDRIPLLVVLIGKLVANGYHEPSALDQSSSNLSALWRLWPCFITRFNQRRRTPSTVPTSSGPPTQIGANLRR